MTVERAAGKLHAAVVAAFEERILSGELRVGSRIQSEAVIAGEFGISTRSVREAMQVLETKGLIRRRHGERSVVVRDDIDVFLKSLTSSLRMRFTGDPEYLSDLMDVRGMFEEHAVRELAARGGLAGAGVEEALERMGESVRRRSFPDYAEADAAFHRALVEAAGNEILSSLYQNLFALITDVIRVSVRVPSKPMKEGLAEHEALLGVVTSGGTDAAGAAIRAHIERSKSYLSQALEARTKREAKDARADGADRATCARRRQPAGRT